jgi:hypothetical protein
VREIATINLSDGPTLDVLEADFFIDGNGLEADSEGNLYVNTAGRVMHLGTGETAALRIFVEMDVRQFLVAATDE